MESSKGKLVILIIVLVGVALLLVFFPVEQPTDEIIPADDSTTIEKEPEWENKLTTVYLYPGDMFFGGNDQKPHHLHFLYFSEIENGVGEAFIDQNQYYFEFSSTGNEFDVFTFNGAFLGRQSFTPGQISNEPIGFGEYGVEYYYYIPLDQNRMFLLLGAQEFPLQFGKNFSFKGTDLLDDGKIDKECFLPAIEEFGFESGKAGTAVFSFDEDEDHELDAKVHLDTETLYPIEPNSRNSYKWQVVFKHGKKWLGYNLEQNKILKKDSFGSVITRREGVLAIKMPDFE